MLLEGGLALGLALYVIHMYLRGNRISKAMDRPVPGALPYHVYMIATSHSLLIAATMIAIAVRIRDPFIWWGTPIAIVAFTVSLIGLVDMLKFQRLRIYRLNTMRQQQGGNA